MKKRYQAGACLLAAVMLMTGCSGNGAANPSGASGSGASSSSVVEASSGQQDNNVPQTPVVPTVYVIYALSRSCGS